MTQAKARESIIQQGDNVRLRLKSLSKDDNKLKALALDMNRIIKRLKDIWE